MKHYMFMLLLCVATLLACSPEATLNETLDQSLLKADLQSSSKTKAVTRPFKMTILDGTWSVGPGDGVSCSALFLQALGEGNATHLGLTNLVEEWCWSGSPDDLGTRSLMLIAANGDMVWGTPTMVLWNSPSSFEEVTEIQGGTGRFEHATGELREYVETTAGDETGAFGTFTFRAEGTITY